MADKRTPKKDPKGRGPMGGTVIPYKPKKAPKKGK